MTNYIILSLKHGSGKNPIYWKRNCQGYTDCPFVAGQFTEEEVMNRQDYFNDGFNSLAIPLTDEALNHLGFYCGYDDSKTDSFLQRSKQG